MTTSAPPIAGVLVTRVVDYEVAGALDGSTPAVGTSIIDDEQVNVVSIAGDAGRFDPSRIDAALQSMGNRYVEWISITPAVPPIAPGAFYVVAFPLQDEQGNDLIPAFGPEAILEIPFSQPQAGDDNFFTTEPFVVIQGAEIRIGGFGSSATRRNAVRMSIKNPTTAWEEAIVMDAWCCAGTPPAPGNGGSGGGGSTVSRETQTFSVLGLDMLEGPSYYFQFSAAITPDPIALNASEGILVDNEGIVPISAQRFAQRPGTITGLVFRTSAPIIASFFVELSVGAGAFVRTVVATDVVIPSNSNETIAIAAVPFDVDTRIRFGYTVTTNATADVQAQLEFTSQ